LKRSDSLVPHVPDSVKALESANESMPNSLTDRSMSISSSVAAGGHPPMHTQHQYHAHKVHALKKLYDTQSTTSEETTSKSGYAANSKSLSQHVSWSSAVTQGHTQHAERNKHHSHRPVKTLNAHGNENLPPPPPVSCNGVRATSDSCTEQKPSVVTGPSPAPQHPPLPKSGGNRKKKRSANYRHQHKTQQLACTSNGIAPSTAKAHDG
jgi:hypothetical protein